MLNRLYQAVGLSAIILLIFGCSKSSESPQVPVNVTFLATGATFDYYYASDFYSDSVKTKIGEQIGVDTFLVRHESPTVQVIPLQYWTIKNNVFYSSFRLRDPNSYVIECKFGKPVGTSWTVKKGSITLTYTIDAVNATITTGKGPVTDAVKIKLTGNGIPTVYQYISPSVGVIGTSNFEETDGTMRLVKYKNTVKTTTTNVIPKISYGNFNFLKVGNYWKYNEKDFMGDITDEVTITVQSKLSNTNIYKVQGKYTTAGTIWYSYWYEDNGYLMVYEDGEQIVQADPIYLSDAKAQIGYGWGGITTSGTTFIYKISDMNYSVDSYFGSLPSTAIDVSNGILSSQTNYWNASKGNIAVSGLFVSRDLTGSNARIDKNHGPLIPVLGF